MYSVCLPKMRHFGFGLVDPNRTEIRAEKNCTRKKSVLYQENFVQRYKKSVRKKFRAPKFCTRKNKDFDLYREKVWFVPGKDIVDIGRCSVGVPTEPREASSVRSRYRTSIRVPRSIPILLGGKSSTSFSVLLH